MSSADERAELGVESLNALLDTILKRYGYDFRQYSQASLRRRLTQALPRLQCKTFDELKDLIVSDGDAFRKLLPQITVSVTEMFRDASFFRALRELVVPHLRTYPSLKIWIAGCATGEEAYSLAILLKEEGLLDKTLIYGTDINLNALEKAKAGIFSHQQMRQATEAYQKAGGTKEFSSYYHSDYSSSVISATLRSKIVFTDHSLVTDSVFSEVQMVLCRNVMIYFDRQLQDRALGLFDEALCRRGFLAIGPKESIRFSKLHKLYSVVSESEKIYQKGI